MNIATFCLLGGLILASIPGKVFWPYFAGTAILAIGIFTDSKEVLRARGTDKIVTLGPLFLRLAMRTGLLSFLCGIGLFTFSGCTPKRDITQEELVRRTQELSSSVAAGDRAPWNKYFADDCMFFDERGRNMTKEALVADITPLPKGHSGSIAVGKVQSHIESNVAIISYDLNEKEIVFGQEETARYHETDTWMFRNGQCQIVAGQVLRYYQDPAAGEIDARMFADYVGTYEVAPGETLTISRDAEHLYRQRSDGSKVALIPEATGIFFRKGVEGRILFRRGEQAKVDALIDRRNNEDVVWKKVHVGSER